MRRFFKWILGWDQDNAYFPLTPEEIKNRQSLGQACLRVFVPFFFAHEVLKHHFKIGKASRNQTPTPGDEAAPGPVEEKPCAS